MTTLLRSTVFLVLLAAGPLSAAPTVDSSPMSLGSAASVSAAPLPTVEVSAPFYRAFIVSEGHWKGRLYAGSGPQHPDALRPLAPATVPSPLDVIKLDSWATLRSYSSGRQYVLAATPGAAGSLVSDPGFECHFLDDVAPSVVELVFEAGNAVAVRQTWSLDLSPDRLEIEQELRPVGSTFASSAVAITLRVLNAGPGPVSLGARLVVNPDILLADIWGAGTNGPPLALRAGWPPPEPYGHLEHQWPSPAEPEWDVYSVRDPSRRRDLYHIGGSLGGTSTLVPPATPPDLFQFTLGYSSRVDDGLFHACLDYQIDDPPRSVAADYNGPQSAVAYYWGLTPETARIVGPGETLSFTTHVFAYADYPLTCAIDAPAQVECSGASTAVRLDGRRSAASDGTPLTFTWTAADPRVVFDDLQAAEPIASLPGPGAYAMDLLVEVGPYSAKASTTINVMDSAPPIVTAPSLTEARTSSQVPPSCGAPVSLAALATDLCAGANVAVTNDRTAGGADASGWYPVADTPVTFVARDPSGNESSIVAVVRVIDDSPPEFTAVTAEPVTLWPPNHRMVSVVINAAVDDNCDPAPAVRIVAVTSNEADDALGDGSTTPDYRLDPVRPNVVHLRAERSGLAAGRVYSIVLEAIDRHGNVATATVAVPVAHDRGSTR